MIGTYRAFVIETAIYQPRPQAPTQTRGFRRKQLESLTIPVSYEWKYDTQKSNENYAKKCHIAFPILYYIIVRSLTFKLLRIKRVFYMFTYHQDQNKEGSFKVLNF
jgi:hypothetical protein